MNRRYICVPTVGSLEQNLVRIRAHIIDEGLAHRYPVVRFERPQRGGGACQLYLFLGVDLEQEESTKRVGSQDRDFLSYCGLRPLVPELFEQSQISGMTGSNAVETVGFWFRYEVADIPPLPPTLQDADDVDIVSDVHSRDDLPFERLLWWLSARGHGSWVDMASAVQALGLGSGGFTPAGVARNLILLGHLEQRPMDGRWSITPPCRVEPVLNRIGGFHAGARGAELIDLAKQGQGDSISPQPGAAGLLRIGLRPETQSGSEAIPSAGVAANRLAECSPSLTDWIAQLPRLDRPFLGGGKLQRFDGRSWQDEPRMREGDTDYRGPSGLYRLLDHDGRAHWSALFVSEPQRWHRADLTGLKFAARALETPEQLRAVLEPESQDLLIPASQRWPLLYERALVLASGWLPSYADGYLRYRAIGRPLAARLTDGLGIALVNGD